MEPSLQSNIFFILGSVVFVMVIILLVAFVVYFIRFMRAVQGMRGAVTKTRLGSVLFGSGALGKSVVATTIVRWIVSFLRRRRRRG